jgi:hypothetical protein
LGTNAWGCHTPHASRRDDYIEKQTAKLAAQAQPHLEDGEQVEYIFVGSKLPQWPLLAFVAVGVLANVFTGSSWVAEGLLFITLGAWILVSEVRVVAVTDRNVVLLRAGKFSKEPRQVISRLPQDTLLGPPSGVFEYALRLGDESVHVLRSAWKDIREADASRSGKT